MIAIYLVVGGRENIPLTTRPASVNQRNCNETVTGLGKSVSELAQNCVIFFPLTSTL